MSGIKENQEITRVKRVHAAPAKQVSFRIAENQLIPTVTANAVAGALILLAPQLIKAAFADIEKITTTHPLTELRKMASGTAFQSVAEISFSTTQSAQNVATLANQIQTARSVEEVKETCSQIKTICLKEQMQAFKEAITATVKTVMNEVGFSNITVKTIGITPVIIAKNQLGQTIRTEVTEGTDSKIDLLRIQSAIPESECDGLNKKINTAFQKYGLEYTRFLKVSKASMQKRSMDFSQEEDFEQNCQTNQLKQ